MLESLQTPDMGFWVMESWQFPSLPKSWIKREAHCKARGFGTTAALILSTALGRQGHGAREIPGTWCWKDSSLCLCASRSELFGVLKLTGNTMDTLQFLGETLWNTLKTLLCRMWV